MGSPCTQRKRCSFVMKLPRLLAAALLLLPASVVNADHLLTPDDAPPEFAAACGGCHIAYPPMLLAAADWRRVMASLDQHFGIELSLEAASRRRIEEWLLRHAGAPRSFSAGAPQQADEPPRLSSTAWFVRKHHETSAQLWRDERIGGAANCPACHSRAAAGSYREREIVLPGAYRWNDGANRRAAGSADKSRP